jgi:intracellular sulfur oxidation DsrE/DsrF family protein
MRSTFASFLVSKEIEMSVDAGRRSALLGFGSAILGAAAPTSGPARAEVDSAEIPQGAHALSELMERLRNAARRRSFKTTPMILDHSDLWDDAALREVIAYRGARKQVWDNTDLESPWLNLMRNSVNAQVFSFGHHDFLAVSATHGSAHLALFDQEMWNKYRLAEMAGGDPKTNTLIVPKAAPSEPSDFEDPKSIFGPAGNTIPALQSRGVVFMACHNAIWEITGKLLAKDVNPDRLSHEAIAAELTNHLIDGVVLTPGIVATIPELQQAGFHYVK